MTFSFSLFLTNFSLSALCIYPPAKYWLSQMNFLNLFLEISKLIDHVVIERSNSKNSHVSWIISNGRSNLNFKLNGAFIVYWIFVPQIRVRFW